MLSFHAISDVGHRRKNNEDSLLAADEHDLFVVADGVGGRKAGELASAITINTFQGNASRIKAAANAYAAEPQRQNKDALLRLLHELTNTASKRVYETATTTNRQGMTTTVVAAVVAGGGAFIAHVGDSRAYLIRAGTARQVTQDHSIVNELLQTGAITPDEARVSKYRNVITRAVGLYPQVKVDTLFLDLVDGDRIMLCTDGLSDLVEEENIAQIASSGNVTHATENLVQQALHNGGTDNVSVIMVEPKETLEAAAVVARAKAMENLFLFRDIPFHARLRVSRIVREVHVKPRDIVVTQGEPGDTLYVVVSGAFAVTVDGVEVASLTQGEHFGEVALVDNSPRSATITSVGTGYLLAIERSVFREFCVMESSLGNVMLWRLLSTLGDRLRHMNSLVSQIES